MEQALTFVGIDVSQASLDVAVRPTAEEWRVANDEAGIAGMPASLMEVLAITQVFERRVINQYARHARSPALQPAVRETLAIIMEDEKWHIKWIRVALKRMEPEFGKQAIDGAIKRFREADMQVYRKTIEEHAQRVRHLLGSDQGGPAW